ncbi:hypothetical protein [Streptomyces sp. B6B3]|uniref:hypothetical protein n=1 Tax=Streptomyces sp. B6B3 TaxID=3153570 RepID=UPI00325E89E0
MSGTWMPPIPRGQARYLHRQSEPVAQQPRHRRLRRQAPLRGRRIGPYAETL